MPAPVIADDLETAAAPQAVHWDPFLNMNALSMIAGGTLPANSPANLFPNGGCELVGGTRTLHNDPLNNLNAWQQSGNYTLANKIITTAPAAGAVAWAGHPDWDDCVYTARFQWSTGVNAQLLVHFVDGNNWIAGIVDGANLILYKDVASVQSQVALIAQALVTATWYWMEITCAGTTYTVKLYADNAGAKGALIQTIAGVIADAALARGRIGIRLGGNGAFLVGGAFANVLTVTGLGPANLTPNDATGSAGGDVNSFAWSLVNAYGGSARSLSIYSPTVNARGYWVADLVPGLVNGISYTARARVKGPASSYSHGPVRLTGIAIGDFDGGAFVYTGGWDLASVTGVASSSAGETVFFGPAGNSVGIGAAGVYYIDQLLFFRTNDLNSQLTMGGFTDLMFGHPDWADGTFAIRFRPDGDGQAQAHECSPEIFWHSTSRVNRQNTYYITANLSYDGKLSMGKLVGGVDTRLVDSATNLWGAGLTLGSWYWLEISSVGAVLTATVYADNAGAKGAVLLTVTANDASLPRGMAGFGNGWSGSIVWGGNYPTVCWVAAPVPAGWRFQSQQGLTDATSGCWSDVQAFSGSRSLSVYYPSTTSYGYWYRTDTPIEGTRLYVASHQARAPATVVQPGFYVSDDGGGNFDGNQSFVANAWAKQRLVFRTTPGAQHVGLYPRPDIGGGAPVGAYYFDAITVQEIGSRSSKAQSARAISGAQTAKPT